MPNLMTVLHYHKLQEDKKAALSLHRGDFDHVSVHLHSDEITVVDRQHYCGLQ